MSGVILTFLKQPRLKLTQVDLGGIVCTNQTRTAGGLDESVCSSSHSFVRHSRCLYRGTAIFQPGIVRVYSHAGADNRQDYLQRGRVVPLVNNPGSLLDFPEELVARNLKLYEAQRKERL